jgi:hypothetical protein
MDLTHRIRISLAAAIALCAAGSIALASSVSAGPPVRMPDLETIKPFGKWLNLGATDGGKPVLHIANRVVNSGEGPLDLFAGEASEQCHEDGQLPEGPDVEAQQRIYQDDGSGGLEPSSEENVGCFEFHVAHDHWHFQDFSQYKLEEMGSGELVAGPSRKIGFCILDGDQALPELPGSPDIRGFDGSGCNQGEPENPPTGMGLSVGWADTYGLFTPGQKLPLKRTLPKGTFCLVSTANPDHTAEGGDLNQIQESNEDNNARRKPVKINLEKQKIESLPGDCS